MERDGEEISIAVHPAMFTGTPHEDFACGDCHIDFDEDDLPHADPIPPAVAACLECHDDLAASHRFHTAFAGLDEESVLEPGLRCDSCHGTHQIHYLEDSAFEFRDIRQTGSCGVCHGEPSIEYLLSAHSKVRESGDRLAPACLDCHTSDAWVAANGYADVSRKIRMANLCLDCHEENPEVSGRTLYGRPFITSFSNSIHGKALFSGNEEAPTCIDCHDSHIVANASSADSKVKHGQVVTRCAQCHVEASENYLKSVHAKSTGLGSMDSPDCTNCHGEHGILAHTDPNSPVAPMNLAEEVCGSCHGSVRLNERYGLPQDRMKTFADSYHGLAARGGSLEAVNCASCHGYHDVRKASDPESLVYAGNLAKTCGQCHEGANDRFSIGKFHVSIASDSTEPVVHWIATIYVWGILIIVGGMFLHNFVDFFHKVREKIYYQKRPHAYKAANTPHRLYLRLTLNERLQHGLLVVSFVVLVITGFMLRYPEAWWVVALRDMNSNIFEWRGLIHRIAGILLCISGVWHVSYISFTVRGRQVFKDLLPRRKDLTDMWGVLRYNLGLAKSKPRFERFSYIEKMEYWAMLWGSILMGVTGFLLWFDNTTIGYLTLLGFDIARTVHFFEAILATVAIIVWHFYFVIFNPDVYPMNLSWLTGYLSEEEMESEHPLELERVKEKAEQASAAPESTEQG